MKLASFDEFRVGVLKGETIVNIGPVLSRLPHRDSKDLMPALIADFEAHRARIEEHVAKEDGVPLSDVRLRAPLPRVRQIDCMATNYLENGTLASAFPIDAFHKSPSAVIGPGETMRLPDIPATLFEAEAEMAVVIGRRAQNVSEADALGHVFGYVNFVDGSTRGLPPKTNSFFQVKSRETFAPMGPFLVTAEEIADPQDLQVRLWINGELRQDFNTDDMAYNVARCISWLSGIHTLEPGDVVATGINHRGLSALHDKDRVELETDGLGRLGFDVSDPLGRTWTRETRLEASEQLVARGGEAPPTGVPATQLSGKYAES